MELGKTASTLHGEHEAPCGPILGMQQHAHRMSVFMLAPLKPWDPVQGSLWKTGQLALPVPQIWNLGHSAASPLPPEGELISPRVSEQEGGQQEKMF